jgi:hypothetical protein
VEDMSAEVDLECGVECSQRRIKVQPYGFDPR